MKKGTYVQGAVTLFYTLALKKKKKTAYNDLLEILHQL